MSPVTEWWREALEATSDPVFWQQFRQIRGAASLVEYSPDPESARADIPFTYDAERLYNTAIQLFMSAAFEVSAGASLEDDSIQHILRNVGRLLYALHISESELSGEEDLLLEAACAFALAGYSANSAVALRLREKTRNDVTEVPTLPLITRLLLSKRIPELHMLTSRWRDSGSHAEIAKSPLDQLLASIRSLCAYTISGIPAQLASAVQDGDQAAGSLATTGDVEDWFLAQGVALDIRRLSKTNAWSQLRDHIGDLGLLWRRYIRSLALGTSDRRHSDVVQENVRTGCAIDLWPSQIAALEEGFLGDSLADCVVKMPTSSGKTRLAEMRMISSLSARPEAKCIYVVPFVALANEIRDTLRASLGRIGLRVGDLFQGEYALTDLDKQLLLRNDVIVSTPEKLDLVLRQDNGLLNQVALFVFDEGHMIDASPRGIRYEFLIDRLLRLRRREDIHFSILVISAVVPNVGDLALWLSGNEDGVVETDWKPTEVQYGVFHWRTDRPGAPNVGRGDISYPDRQQQGERYYVPNVIQREIRRTRFYPRTKSEICVRLARALVNAGPVAVFAATRRNVDAVVNAALDAAARTGISFPIADGDEHRRNLEQAISVCREYLGENHKLLDALELGFAYHTGTVPQAVRAQIEKLYQAGTIQVVVCTNTLAQGVNLPVKSLIIHSLSRGASGNISPRDFQNMAGRAARALHQIDGQVVFVHDDATGGFTRAELAIRNNDNIDGYVLSGLLLLYAELVTRRAELVVDDSSRQLFGALSSRFGFADDEDRLNESLATLDAQLLGLLVEEAVPDVGFDASTILGGSLFSIQAAGIGIDTASIYGDLTARIQSIADDISEPDTRRRYFQTGLSSRSCRSVLGDSEAFLDLLRLAPENISDAGALLRAALQISLSSDETRPSNDLVLSGELDECFVDWINGVSVGAMTRPEGVGSEDLSLVIEDAFVRKFPWGFNSVMILLRNEIEARGIEIRPYLTFLAALSRYGVPSIEAAICRAVGVSARSCAVQLASRCPSGSDYEAVIAWLSELQLPEIADIVGDEQVAQRVLEELTSAQLGNPGAQRLQDSAWADVEVRGLRHYTNWTEVGSLEPGELLELRREPENPYDENAVQVIRILSGQMLGYVQRDYARIVSPLLDAAIPVAATVSRVSEPTPIYPAGLLFISLMEV